MKAAIPSTDSTSRPVSQRQAGPQQPHADHQQEQQPDRLRPRRPGGVPPAGRVVPGADRVGQRAVDQGRLRGVVPLAPRPEHPVAPVPGGLVREERRVPGRAEVREAPLQPGPRQPRRRHPGPGAGWPARCRCRSRRSASARRPRAGWWPCRPTTPPEASGTGRCAAPTRPPPRARPAWRRRSRRRTARDRRGRRPRARDAPGLDVERQASAATRTTATTLTTGVVFTT